WHPNAKFRDYATLAAFSRQLRGRDVAVGHVVTDSQAMLGGKPTVHLEHHPRGVADRDRPKREWLGIRMDADDPPVARDEDHVEGDRRVLHPERVILLGIEEEHHPVVWIEMI